MNRWLVIVPILKWLGRLVKYFSLYINLIYVPLAMPQHVLFLVVVKLILARALQTIKYRSQIWQAHFSVN